MPRSLRQTGRIGGIIHQLGAIVLVTSLPVVAASKSACLFVPGYKLGDEENYASIKADFQAAGTEFLFRNDTVFSEGPLEVSSIALAQDVRQQSRQGFDQITLFGHSRGASVCALALLHLLSSQSQPEFKLPKLVLCLMDPVDDAERTCISSWARATVDEKWPKVRVNIIATPYGGFSRYYRKKLSSSCAPPGRDAEALGSVLASVSASALEVEMWSYPNLGHLQLLDESVKDSPLYSVCPTNGDIGSGASVLEEKSSAMAVIRRWAAKDAL